MAVEKVLQPIHDHHQQTDQLVIIMAILGLFHKPTSESQTRAGDHFIRSTKFIFMCFMDLEKIL